MPAFVTATVLRWEADPKDPRTLNVVDSTLTTVLVSDAVSSADKTPVIVHYILGAIEKEDPKKLLRAARDGLLQVMEMSRVPLTTPSVPPTQPGEHTGRKAS